MLGDKRVVMDEAWVDTGEMLAEDDVGEDDSGVIIVDESDVGEMTLDKYKDILISRIIGKELEVDVNKTAV